MDINRNPKIPAELWYEVLSYLRLRDRKQLRLVNKEWNRIATPLCFEKIQFEISAESVSRVVQIAECEELAHHVRKLVLRRSRALREFKDFDAWKGSIVLPGGPNENLIIYADEDNGDGNLMSYQEWSSVSDLEKEALYKEYKRDCEQLQDLINSSTAHLRLRGLGCAQGERVHPDRAAEEGVALERFEEAMTKFPNLDTFSHEPGFLYDKRWGTWWRQFRMPWIGNIPHPSDEQDEDVEALQLSVVLSALGQAKQFHPKLYSMSFYAFGPAFWSPDRLLRLWVSNNHAGTRTLRRIMGSAEDADTTKFCAEHEEHLRKDLFMDQLAVMGNALVGLTYLNCTVSEQEGNGGLFIVGDTLWDFLRCAKNLERLRLVFGELEHGKLPLGYKSRDYNHAGGLGNLLYLLTIYHLWPKMRELELELVTTDIDLLEFLSSLSPTLRHLSLTNVTLLPHEGTWESTLLDIAECLDLDVLKVSRLCDYGSDNLQRRFFQQGVRVLQVEDLRNSDLAAFAEEHCEIVSV